MARVIERPWFARRTEQSRVEAEPDDERVLVERARHDREAFAPLYDQYLTPVYRFCFARLGSRDAAEDATSIIFTKALTSIGACDPGRFRSWLFAIARNVVVDAQRARVSIEPIESAEEIADPSFPESALIDDESGGVLALLRHLTDEQRTIVELRLAGLSGVEIADALGRSPGAIRVAQFRAYGRLRELMGEAETLEGERR